jgi:hypothetical protein
MPAFGWNVSLPVIRAECGGLIDAVAGADVELLPLDVEGDSLIMVHPLTVVVGALDLEKSELHRIPDLIFGVRRYEFHPAKLPTSGIFRLDEVPHSSILMTADIVADMTRVGPLNVAFDLLWSAD